MKILSLKTNGFRKFAGEFKTNFYDDITYISGGNHKGKTNILFAIVWAFFGSNLTGDEKPYLGNNSKDEFAVELKFKDNQDKTHTIIRYKNKYNSKKNFLTLDGKIVKQEDLKDFYYDRNLFLAIINLYYFVGLQPAKQKELIDKYLPDVEIKSVYNNLSKEEKKILDVVPDNVKSYITELDDEIKIMTNKISNLQGQIDYAENIANEIIKLPPKFEKQEELDFAIQELDHLKSNNTNSNKKELENKLDELQKEEFNLKLEIRNMDNELQSGKKTYQEMLENTESCCPTCNQKLANNSKVIATKKYRNDLITLYEKQTKLKERYKKVHFDKVACEGKIYSLQDLTTTISPETLIQLENNIKSLELEKQEMQNLYSEYLAKVNNKKKSKNDIENLSKQIILLNKSIADTKNQSEIAKKLYINCIKEKMKAADKYLKDVKISYYKVVRGSGEIKDDFIITYKNKDFNNLSRSERIAASLEIANMLNKVSNLNIPLFIDDSETCPDFDFKSMYNDNQLFIAQVKKGKSLTITNGNQLIKGYTSNKNYKKSNNKKQFISVA